MEIKKVDLENFINKSILIKDRLIFTSYKSLFVLDIKNNKETLLREFTSRINELKLLSGNRFVLCTESGEICLFSEKLELIKEVENKSEVFGCDCLSDGRIVSMDLYKIKLWHSETDFTILKSRVLGDMNRFLDLNVYEDKIYIVSQKEIAVLNADGTIFSKQEFKKIELNGSTFYRGKILFATTECYVGLYPEMMIIASSEMHPYFKFLSNGTILVQAPSNSVIISEDGKQKLKDIETKYITAEHHAGHLLLGTYEGEVLIEGFPNLKVCDKSILQFISLSEKEILVITTDIEKHLFRLTY
jgi:hypothetical protein